MTNRYPLIIDAATQRIRELPSGDNLDLTGNGISAVRNIIPETSETYDLGTDLLRWKDLYLSGNSIYLGSSVVSTVDGNLTLTASLGGTIELVNDTNITGNLDVTGDINLGGNITIGNEPFNGGTGDTITVVADFSSNLIPKDPNTYNIGAEGQAWGTIYVQTAVVGGITLGTGGTVDLGDVSIHDNIIEITPTDTNLIVRANGTGVIVPQSTIDFSVGNLDFDTGTFYTITNVPDPINSQDVATKNYVDLSISSDILLNLVADATVGSINVYNENLTIYGTDNEITTEIVDNQVIIGLPDDVTVSGVLSVTGNLVVTGDLNSSVTEFDLVNTTATTVNFAGAATDVQIGASTGTTNVNNNLVVDGTVKATGGTVLSEGTNIDQITVYTKSITLTQDWQDTGIDSTDLASGTYFIQLYASDISSGGTNNNEYYSGIMSWYAGATDSSVELPTDEIVLHRAGASSDAGLYLRTFRSLSGDLDNLKLQIYSNATNPSAANYVFKFRRVI